MRKRVVMAAALGIATVAIAIYGLVGAHAAAPVEAIAGPRAPQLSADAQRVVDYLLEDWSQRFHSTSIPRAMQNLGMEPDDELRLEIGRYFRDNVQIANNLQYWGANNYIFSNQEKLIAKYLIAEREKKDRTPALAEAAAVLHLGESELRERLAFMAAAGFLQRDPGQDLGFSLAPGYKRWAGPLQHNFHTVTVDEGKPFDVW